MAFTWYSALELGIREVDDQHRELFRRIDLLVDAMVRRSGPAELASLFDFLGQYVFEHFSEEEALMRVSGYPQRAEHEVEHERFVADLKVLRQEYATEGPTALLLVKMNGRVTQWLADHIARTDKLFGQFYKTRRPG